MMSDDESLIGQIAEGDEEALRQLYASYRVRLWQYLWPQLDGDGQRVEEVLQDVFLAVWRQARTFRGEAGASTWLFCIARNRASNAMRDRARQPEGYAESLATCDDASAHCTRVSAITAPSEHGLSLTTDAASGKQLLYTVQPRVTSTAPGRLGGETINYSADPTDLKVSTDGGKTWENAPSAGIPADLKAGYDSGVLGTLHDGSIVVEFIAKSAQDAFSGGTLYAWKRGDSAWHQIAPPITQEIGSILAIPARDASQQDMLYLVLVNRGGAGSTIDTFRFLRYVP